MGVPAGAAARGPSGAGGATARGPSAGASSARGARVLAAEETAQTAEQTTSSAAAAANASKSAGSTSSQSQEEGDHRHNQSLLGQEEQTEDGADAKDSDLSTNTQEDGQELLQKLLLAGTGLNDQFTEIGLDVIGNSTGHATSGVGEVEVQGALGEEALGVVHEVVAHLSGTGLNGGSGLNSQRVVQRFALTSFIGFHEGDTAEELDLGVIEHRLGLAEELRIREGMYRISVAPKDCSSIYDMEVNELVCKKLM